MHKDTGALLALWNDVTPEMDAAYNDWHANEHVPERLAVPGMRWARRYAALPGTAGPRYLTLYGLRDVRVLESDAYRRLLSDPTPASARMRPHLCNLSRWVCQVHALRGSLDGDGLAVRTFDTRDAALCGPQGATDDAELLAERLPDATPLPWLQAGQQHAIAGQWLRALAFRGAPQALARESLLYAALPVSTASHRS